MGADLYIKKLESDKQITGYRTDVNVGYFRDAYNATNIFWKLDLSYWNIEKCVDIGPLEEGAVMSIEQVKILLSEVQKRKSRLDKFLEQLDERWLKENHCSIGDDGVEGWKELFTKKYQQLVSFLQKAVELDSAIIWSV